MPTRNSAATLAVCLSSIQSQTYADIELIVVDRDSTDETKSIAKRYTSMVLNHGPERTAQRNFGASQASGQYVGFIDSDMELAPGVVAACVNVLAADPAPSGVIIPEASFGDGFWAQCKALERSFYVGNSAIEAARMFPRRVFTDIGGYNETLVSGEDWDLSRRAATLGPITRVTEFIRHNEGRPTLRGLLAKKFYYARHARSYLAASGQGMAELGSATGPWARYKLFFSRPRQLFARPSIGLGMLLMKTLEFAAGAIGLVVGAVFPPRKNGAANS